MSGSDPYHTVPCILPQCLASSWAPSRLARAGHLGGHSAHRIHWSSSRDIRLPPPPVIIHMDENTNLLIFSCPTGWKPYGILASSPGRAARRIDPSLFSRAIPPSSGRREPSPPRCPLPRASLSHGGKKLDAARASEATVLNVFEAEPKDRPCPPAQLDRKGFNRSFM